MNGIQKKNQAFTLVELIVVIAILSILATIAFLSYQGYSANARDSGRLNDLENLKNSLTLRLAKAGTLPRPGSAVSITASGVTIGYQGYADKNVLDVINMSNAKDPLDGTYYTYSIDPNQTKFQILGFLENSDNIIYSYSRHPEPAIRHPELVSESTDQFVGILNQLQKDIVPVMYADASDYSKRFIVTRGQALGILLASGTLVPVQVADAGVDIVNTSTVYVGIINDTASGRIIGAGSSLRGINPRANCKRIFESGYGRMSGEFILNPDGGSGAPVYCSSEYKDKIFYNYIVGGDMEDGVASNWPLGGIISQTTEDKNTGNYSLRVGSGGTTIFSNNYTYIQPGKNYTLHGFFKLKNGSTTPANFYFGFAEYDENFVFIANADVNAIPGTDTTLALPVTATDTGITFNCNSTILNSWSGSLAYHTSVAFNTDDSGEYNDLPNRNRSNVISNVYNQGVSGLVVDNGNSTCTLKYNLVVGYKAGVNYPAGTKIRMHNSGLSYNYRAASGVSEQTTWTNYSGTVSGISKYGVDPAYFRRGTKFARVLILPNYWSRIVNGIQYSWQENAVVYIDNVGLDVVN